MLSSIKRLASLFVATLAVAASAVDTCLTKAAEIAVLAASVVIGFGIKLAAMAAGSSPNHAAKRPTGTAAERLRLIPSTAYALAQAARRQPAFEPWRMAVST